jgi:nucleoside-diphosphate-sugar epimerase
MEFHKNDFMNKILILGATGLLGESLVEYFSSNNFKVGALSRGCDERENNLINTYAVDALDYESLEPIIAQYDIVVNCIGQVTNPIYDCITLNSRGVQNIVDAVKKNGNYLIHLSTVSVYGTSSHVTENSPVNPESVYGAIKYFAEYQISQNLTNFMILRVSNLYGKGQTKGILEYITRSFYSNDRNLFFNNDGSLKRYYLHIDDLSAIVEIALTNKLKGVYNIIGKDFLTIKQLIALCERVFNYSFNVKYESKSPIENVDEIDNSKFVEQINYTFQNNVEAYLK